MRMMYATQNTGKTPLMTTTTNGEGGELLPEDLLNGELDLPRVAALLHRGHEQVECVMRFRYWRRKASLISYSNSFSALVIVLLCIGERRKTTRTPILLLHNLFKLLVYFGAHSDRVVQ